MAKRCGEQNTRIKEFEKPSSSVTEGRSETSLGGLPSILDIRSCAENCIRSASLRGSSLANLRKDLHTSAHP